MLGMQLDSSANLENINSMPHHHLCLNCLSYLNTITIRGGLQRLRLAVPFPLDTFLSSF